MLLWMILFMFPVVHFFLFFIMVHDLLFYAACTSPSCRPSSDRIVWNQFRSYACAPLRGTSSNMLANALRRDNSEKAKEIFSFLLPHRHLNCALRVHDFRLSLSLSSLSLQSSSSFSLPHYTRSLHSSSSSSSSSFLCISFATFPTSASSHNRHHECVN